MTASAGTVATQATAADAATVSTTTSTATSTAANTTAAVVATTTARSVESQSGTAVSKAAKTYSKLSKAAKQRIKAYTAVSVAKKHLGDPYRWGATGPRAFDCSGLVMYAWRKAGVRLPRVAASQFRAIRKKISWKDLRPGDLLFFYGLGHVGMYVGHGKMIHSPHTGARVRIDKLTGYRRAAFVGAVRPGV